LLTHCRPSPDFVRLLPDSRHLTGNLALALTGSQNLAPGFADTMEGRMQFVKCGQSVCGRIDIIGRNNWRQQSTTEPLQNSHRTRKCHKTLAKLAEYLSCELAENNFSSPPLFPFLSLTHYYSLLLQDGSNPTHHTLRPPPGSKVWSSIGCDRYTTANPSPTPPYPMDPVDPDNHSWVYDRYHHIITHHARVCVTCDDYFNHYYNHYT
jgi:hypothetical protein